jgi:hypothetical protein
VSDAETTVTATEAGPTRTRSASGSHRSSDTVEGLLPDDAAARRASTFVLSYSGHIASLVNLCRSNNRLSG